MIFLAQSLAGKLSLGSEYNRARFQDWLNKNPNGRLRIEPLLPESKKQRKFYHGAVIPLWAYLNEMDYRDGDTLDFLHQEAKKEFNGELVMLDGKRVLKGKSTRGILNEYVNRVIDNLEEQYGIDRFQVLDPKEFKKWRDSVKVVGDPECYIDYMKLIGKLK